MQPTMTRQPAPELPFLATSLLSPRSSFELTPEGHIEHTINQLAALLISISRNNHYEGRDPTCIPDDLASGFVAELLGVKIGRLADALIALQQRGLVKADGHRLRLTNVIALERLAG